MTEKNYQGGELMGTVIAIAVILFIIAFPNATETVLNGIGNIFMMIITPLIEHLAQILK